MQWPIPPFPTKMVQGNVGILTSSANTKSSYSTLLSSLPAPASWVNIGTNAITNAGDRGAIMDLAIGGAGSETIVAADLIIGYRWNQGTLFPLHIPAGATLRARFATPLSFMNIQFRATAYIGEPDSGLAVPGRITTYGSDAANSGGTAVTPSGTQSVKGSYVQLTAATTAPIHALMVMAQCTGSSPPVGLYAVDIAVGGSGSETIVLPDQVMQVENTGYLSPLSPQFVPCSLSIPSGVRLSARCAVLSGNVSTPIEVAVYGFTY